MHSDRWYSDLGILDDADKTPGRVKEKYLAKLDELPTIPSKRKRDVLRFVYDNAYANLSDPSIRFAADHPGASLFPTLDIILHPSPSFRWQYPYALERNNAFREITGLKKGSSYLYASIGTLLYVTVGTVGVGAYVLANAIINLVAAAVAPRWLRKHDELFATESRPRYLTGMKRFLYGMQQLAKMVLFPLIALRGTLFSVPEMFKALAITKLRYYFPRSEAKASSPKAAEKTKTIQDRLTAKKPGIVPKLEQPVQNEQTFSNRAGISVPNRMLPCFFRLRTTRCGRAIIKKGVKSDLGDHLGAAYQVATADKIAEKIVSDMVAMRKACSLS